jgi:hypothetical protein
MWSFSNIMKKSFTGTLRNLQPGDVITRIYDTQGNIVCCVCIDVEITVPSAEGNKKWAISSITGNEFIFSSSKLLVDYDREFISEY